MGRSVKSLETGGTTQPGCYINAVMQGERAWLQGCCAGGGRSMWGTSLGAG